MLPFKACSCPFRSFEILYVYVLCHIDCLFPSFKYHVLFIPFFGFLWICFHPAKKKTKFQGQRRIISNLDPLRKILFSVTCFLLTTHPLSPIVYHDFSHVSAFNSGPVSSNSLSTRRQRFPNVFMALLCSTASLAAARFDARCASRCRAWGQGLQRQQPAILSWEPEKNGESFLHWGRNYRKLLAVCQ